MRISESTKLRAAKARERFQETGNLSQTARELGIHRSTLDRWQKEGLLDEGYQVEGLDTPSLDQLVTKGISVLDQALDGEKVSSAQIRAAIEVTKLSNVLRTQAKAEEAKQSLAELIAEEDDRSEAD